LSGQGFQAGEDRVRALETVNVSRETSTRLEQFVALLLKWQSRINLIAPSTIPAIWTRHIADSLQLLDLAPTAKTWVDFGSGGGFPAIPIACALADYPGTHVHLIESNGKKAAFLREAGRVLDLPAEVHAMRAENFGESWPGRADAVSARALAPLKILCDQAFPLIAQGAVGLFPKGQDVDAELTQAAKYWTIQASKVPSKTSPAGSIVVVRGLARRQAAGHQPDTSP
jgi:16S rRNA (guanine527-N7)-methyltransferase